MHKVRALKFIYLLLKTLLIFEALEDSYLCGLGKSKIASVLNSLLHCAEESLKSTRLNELSKANHLSDSYCLTKT